MSLSFGFFSDSALTTAISSPLQFIQAISSPTAEDNTIYFGSATASRVCEADSNPGVDAVTVSIVDSAGGSGSPATDVKLALSSGGLSSATGGATLALPETINSGSANAIPIYVRVLDSTHAGGLNLDLSLQTNTLLETPA